MVSIEQSALRVEPKGHMSEFQGRDHGSGVSFIMISTDENGAGPA